MSFISQLGRCGLMQTLKLLIAHLLHKISPTACTAMDTTNAQVVEFAQ